MPDTSHTIRYVCLSDLHLGEQHGLLTGVTREGNLAPLDGEAGVLDKLVGCFGRLWGEQPQLPTLILLGDALELALTSDNFAYMAFERFVDQALVQHRLFKDIVYIPGNHDHHLWEGARETQYLEKYLRGKLLEDLRHQHLTLPPTAAPLKAGWHGTSMFVLEEKERKTPLVFIEELIRRFPVFAERGSMPVYVAYPHFGLRTPDGKRAVIFHHGHYLEDLYHLMTNFRQVMFDGPGDLTLEDIEASNFAWIDFFWSTMGRSGSVGPKIDLLYTLLSQRPRQLDDYAENLGDGIASRLGAAGLKGPDWFTKWFEARVIEGVFHQLFAWVGKSGRRIGGEASDDALRQRLSDHLTGPVSVALAHECEDDCATGYAARLPEELTFVFGHTHKPLFFAETVGFPGSHDSPPSEQTVPIYNVGGWVVDHVEPDKVHGAAALLLDDDLTPAYLHLYQETGLPRPRAIDVPVETAPNSEFCAHVEELIQSDVGVWDELAAAFAETRARRAKSLEAQIDLAHDIAQKARRQKRKK